MDEHTLKYLNEHLANLEVAVSLLKKAIEQKNNQKAKVEIRNIATSSTRLQAVSKVYL